MDNPEKVLEYTNESIVNLLNEIKDKLSKVNNGINIYEVIKFIDNQLK